MDEAQMEVVRAYVATFSGVDLVADLKDPHAAWIEYIHPDVSVRLAEETPGVRTYRGPEGARRAFAEWAEAWEEFRMEPTEFIDAGKRAVVVFEQSGRGKASGAEVEGAVAQSFTVTDGKISGIHEYSSREAALAAAAQHASG